MAAYRVAALSLCVVLAMTTAEMQTRYPETRKADQVDDYFGRKVADPYRWLEDDNSAGDRGVGRGAEQGHLRLPGADPRARAAEGSG